jgi:F-type H+-transporting ATPase subunit epsilon
MSKLQVIIVTPEATALDQSAESVSLPLIDGEAGVLAGHAPMVGRLGPGELRVVDGGSQSNFYIDGGTVQIKDDVVSVLTGRSCPVSEIDVAAAKEALEKAESMEGGTAALAEIKNKALSQARTQLRLAQR